MAKVDHKSRVNLMIWHDWLVNHVRKTIKDRASRASKAFNDKVIGLYKDGNLIEDKTQPYQLKPRRGKEPPMEQKESPLTNPKQIKRMKKKLGELNRKIRHSKKKNDGLIHKRNSLRRAIEELKRGTRQAPIERRQGFTERERAFGGAYRSYRIDGRSRTDVDTFLSRIRG